MALSNIKLRILTNALLSTKGSILDNEELDQNIIEIVNAIVALNGSTSIEEYNAVTTYIGGETYYVSYGGNIYKFVSATNQTGVTPVDGLIWELTSAGALVHEQNTDTQLAKGTAYSMTAQRIYEFLQNHNATLTPAIDIVSGLAAPPTSTQGHAYIIDTGVEIVSTAINWQSGTTVRFQYAGSTDLSAYSAGMYLSVKDCPNSSQNGIHLITTVNDASDYIEVTNSLVTDATKDSTTSTGYVSNGLWGGVAQNDWVILIDDWERLEPIEGLKCYNKTTERTLVFNGTSWSYTEPKIYKALISQSGTSDPTAIVLENTLGEVPTFTYVAVGDFIINSALDLFEPTKTFKQIESGKNDKYVSIEDIDTDFVQINVKNIITGVQENVLENVSILIEVYD